MAGLDSSLCVLAPRRDQPNAGLSRVTDADVLGSLRVGWAPLALPCTMAEGAAGSTFWFNVSYGAGETALFNADCWAVVLLDYMKEHCGYAHLDEPVDLLKEDQSCSLDLRLVGKESATTVLEPKGKYILAKVIAPEAEGGAPTFEALWEAPEGYEPPPPPPPAGKKK